MSGSSSVRSHIMAFQKITGTKEAAATNQRTAVANCWSAAALRPPGTCAKFP